MATVPRRRPARKPPQPYRLTSPGVPPAGANFRALAVKRTAGEDEKRVDRELERLYWRALHSSGNFVLPIDTGKGNRVLRMVLGGHLWGDRTNRRGPVASDVMVIGKMLGDEEVIQQRHFCGPTGQHLLETARNLGGRGLARWYVTNVLKCDNPDLSAATLKAAWLKDFMPLLHWELRMVRPKYILCLGADAIKALLGKQATVGGMEGRVVEFSYSLQRTEKDKNPQRHTALVMACLHPAQVLRAPELQEQFDFTVNRFLELSQGKRWDQAEEGLDHRVISNITELESLIEEIEGCDEAYERRADGSRALVLGLDAEWHGEHPQNKGAYLRTIQVSWKDRTAAAIHLASPGGKKAFGGGQVAAIAALNRLLKSNKQRDVRLVGHFLAADLEHLVPRGLDLREEFAAPEHFRDTAEYGGFDTGLAFHAIEETASLSLTSLALRHTTAPRYDIKLTEWKTEYCKANNLKAKFLEGYGACPDEILLPYACYDPDVTRRLYFKAQDLLDCDRFGNSCREAFWINQRANAVVLEINCAGVNLDRKRVDTLTAKYMKAKKQLETRIREWAKWPTLNLQSLNEFRELLFGEKLNGKKTPAGQEYVRLRPPGARSLRLTPIMTTGKRPEEWSRALEKWTPGDTPLSPSTDKKSLAILAQENQQVQVWSKSKNKTILVDKSPQLTWLRDHRFIGQVLKSVLRIPRKIKGSEEFYVSKSGYWEYDSGLPGAMCGDGRVRTRIWPTKETGRWSSSSPPLQNLSKKRESDYARILGDDYDYPIRSVICASEGMVLLEADYLGAELLGAAIMSGDALLMEHCMRGQLPEDHPDYYDIHSNIAVLSFGYKCPPTKKGLDSIGKSAMRIVAKEVIFGALYGRGAKAIALAVKEQGVYVTIDDAQRIIDTIFTMYSQLASFFLKCRERIALVRFDDNDRERIEQGPLWIRNAFGRLRRAYWSDDRKVQGELERQFMNFPIQSMIADAINRAVDHLHQYRKQPGAAVRDFRILLQVHDALLFECRPDQVSAMVDEVLPECMIDKVPICPCDLDGIPTGEGPFRLGIDTEVAVNWGIKLTKDDCRKLGVPERFGKAA